MFHPGFEPGLTDWKPVVLTTRRMKLHTYYYNIVNKKTNNSKKKTFVYFISLKLFLILKNFIFKVFVDKKIWVKRLWVKRKDSDCFNKKIL